MKKSRSPIGVASIVLASAVLSAAIAEDLPSNPPAPAAAKSQAASESAGPAAKTEYETLSLRGQVRFLGEALANRFGVKSVKEAGQRQLVLETPQGELHPLVEDVRGRAFRADARLRELDVELLVRRYKGSPFVQIIQVFSHKAGKKFELDYWCDICAIVMFESKPCDCCQADNRLREREVDSSEKPAE